MITAYSFGKMKIDAETYFTDLMILDDTVIPNWWRKEGHKLSLQDVEQVIRFHPDVLIVGTGYMGMMKVPKEIEEVLRSEGIDLIVANSRKSWTLFNEQRKIRKAAAAFHLTC